MLEERKSQISKFAAGKVFWFRLVLLPIRKKGALNLGEAGDFAPEKPEGTQLQELCSLEQNHSCVLTFQTSFPLGKEG